MPGGENGTIMKKSDPKERVALCALMDDPLRSFVPEFKGEVDRDGEGILVQCVASVVWDIWQRIVSLMHMRGVWHCIQLNNGFSMQMKAADNVVG